MAAIELEYQGAIAIITLNKPAKLNALSKDEYYQLAQTLNEIATHTEVIVTVLTGRGRFFSAGADVSIPRALPSAATDTYATHLTTTVARNLNLARAFYTHPKILVAALNGPAVGMSAALVAHADFVYCVPGTYLLTPFASLGLVSEGVSSEMFVRRMGTARANEALMMGKRIGSGELRAVGFVNEVFEADGFGERVLREVRGRFCEAGLNGESVLLIKELMVGRRRRELDAQSVVEVFGALDRNVKGIPQKEFEKLRKGEKKHKL